MADKYYAMIDGERKGPFALEDLPAAGVRPSTYIWCKGMPDWQMAEENADVCRLFRNHLYDIMHPADRVFNSSEELEKYKVKKDEPTGPPPTRFDRFLQETGNDPLPTLEEIDKQQDKSLPPVNMIGYAWLATLFCFLPTGIVGLIFAYKSKKAWKNGENDLAHDYSRRAKMWTGISFFIGIIAYGFLLALSM